GVGGQILWRPTGAISIVGNQYYGKDTLGKPDRRRLHTDDSFMGKYYESPDRFLSQAAGSLTLDTGCASGDGVTASCPYFAGCLAYNRLWSDHDRFGFTVGGGAIRNPGRYLVLVPPINGATALSGTQYFTANPGDEFEAWDTQIAGDYAPKPFITFRLEYNY